MARNRESDTGDEEREAIPRKRERVADEDAAETGEEEKEVVQRRVRVAEEDDANETGEEEKGTISGKRKRLAKEEDITQTGKEEKGHIPGKWKNLAQEVDGIETGEEGKEAFLWKREERLAEEEDALARKAEEEELRRRAAEEEELRRRAAEEEELRRRAAEEEKRKRAAVEEWRHLALSVQRTLAVVATSEGPFTAIDALYQRCSELANELGATIRNRGIMFAHYTLTVPDSPWQPMVDAACIEITRLTALHLQAGNLFSLCASHLNFLDDPLWQNWNGHRAEVDSAVDEVLEFTCLASSHLEMFEDFIRTAQHGLASFGPVTNLVLLQSAAVQLKKARDAVLRLSKAARLECMAAGILIQIP